MAYKTSIITPAGGKLNLDDDVFLLPQNDTNYRLNCISTEPSLYNSITNVRGFKKFSNISIIQRIPVYRTLNEYDIYSYFIPIYEDLNELNLPLFLKIRWRRYNSQIIDEYTTSFYNVSDFLLFMHYPLQYWYKTYIKNIFPNSGFNWNFEQKYFLVYFDTDYFEMYIEREISVNSIDIVGGVEDIEEDILYLFSRTQEGVSFIHRFNQQTENFDTLLVSYKVLNFQYDTKIDANVIGSGEEKVLVWTDGINPPRKLLISKALRTNSVFTGYKTELEDVRYFRLTDEELYVGAIPPSKAPTYTYGSDVNYKINDIRGKLYQFAYRYVYDDDSMSVWSDLSPITYPTDEEGLNFIFINDITKNNYINIKYYIPYNVKRIEFGYRVADIGNGNVGNFYVFKSIDNDNRFLNRDAYLRFYGNEQAYVISDVELNKLHDHIPLVARNQEVIKDTTLVYGDIDEGLESVKTNSNLVLENNNVIFNINKQTLISSQVEESLANITLSNTCGITERFFVIKATNKGIRLDTNITNDEYIEGIFYVFVWNSNYYVPEINSFKNYILSFNLNTQNFSVLVFSPLPSSSWFAQIPLNWIFEWDLPIDDVESLMRRISSDGLLNDFYRNNSFNTNKKNIVIQNISNISNYLWDYQLMNLKFDLYQIAASNNFSFKLLTKEHSVYRLGKYIINFSSNYKKPFCIIKLDAGVDFFSIVYNGETYSELLNKIVSYFNNIGYNFSINGDDLIFTHNNKLWHGGFYIELYDSLYKTSTLSKNEKHYFSIAYRDKFGRISYGNDVIEVVDNLKYFDNGINLGKIKYTINHKPPDYAVSYLWLYGGSNVIDKRVYYFNKNYVEFDWKYTYFDFDRIIVELSDTIENYNETTQEITDNTILRILGYWNGNAIVPFSKEYVFDILGKDADGRMYTMTIENETELVNAINNNGEIVGEVCVMRRGDKDNMIFYHTGLEYPIVNGYHYGSVQTQTQSQSAIGYLPFTNAHLHFTVVRKDLYALIESRKYSFIYNSQVNNFGKLNIIQTNVKRDRYIKLRYGGRFYHDAEYNYMFSFDADNEKWLNKDNGAIVAMIMRGDTLRIYQNKKACSIYLSATMAMSPDGNEIAVQVKDILGYIRENTEDYGSFHPLSFAKDEQYVYFFDANNMDLIRDTINGFYPLGLNFKCKSFFIDIVNKGIDNYKVVGGIDPQTKMYYLTFKHKNNGESYTIGFNELFNRFESFYSFYPDIYISTVNNLYSTIYQTKDAFLYKHNASNVNNVFYNQSVHNTELDIYCNELPIYNKMFYAIGVHSNLQPDSSQINDIVVYERDNNTRVSLIPEYEYKEDIWRADILRDMNDLDNPYYSLYNGRQMKGGVGKFRIRFTNNDKLNLRFIEINYLHQL